MADITYNPANLTSGGSGSGAESITYTATGSENSVTISLSTFSSAVKDLDFTVYGAIGAAVATERVHIQFNADASSSYDSVVYTIDAATPSLAGSGIDGVALARISAFDLPGTSGLTNGAGMAKGTIAGFTGTAKHKLVVGDSFYHATNSPTTATIARQHFGGYFRKVGAITSITFFTHSSNNFTSDTVFNIYGK